MTHAHARSGARRVIAAAAAMLALAVTIVALPTAAGAATEVDFTDFPGTLTTPVAKTGPEGTESAVDGYTDTKYLTEGPSTWLQFALTTPAVVNRYTITSANDAPDRDPGSWVLDGSNNGSSYTTLDSRSGQAFTSRFQQRSFSFTNSTAYRYYRLRNLAGNGGGLIQLSEWQLLGPSSTAVPLTVPTAVVARALAGNQVQLAFTKARWQTAFDVERSTDGVNWSALAVRTELRNDFRDFTAQPSTSYQYRIRGRGAAGVSPWVVSRVTTPALSWPSSTTATNGKPMTQRFSSGDVVLYAEPGRSNADVSWMISDITRIWRYVKQNYPAIGNDRLQVFIFAAPGGGTAIQRIDPRAGYKNTIEAGWSGATDEGRLNVITHEIGHLVDGFHDTVSGSPGAALWADSMWCDFFTYDVYQGLGLTADAQRVYDERMAQTVDFPRPGTYWFRDWFYPIWRDYGRTAVLNRYFDLVAARYPSLDHYHQREFNYGEFVHFWSGAAGVDLKPVATQAFGWTAEYQQQLEQARREFPGVVYPHS